MTTTWVGWSTGRLPAVRLVDGGLRCFDAVCDAEFGRRADEGFVLFLPGWVYQGEIWRSQSLEDEVAVDGGDVDQMWGMADRMPRGRNEPDLRQKFASSRLPAHVLCPKCRHLQMAERDVLDSAEARVSLAPDGNL
jgi:hypothetical protein